MPANTRPTRRGFLIAGGYVTATGLAGAAGVGAHRAMSEPSAPSTPSTPAPDVTPAPVLAAAAERAEVFDPEQRFLQVVGGGDGVLFAIQADGRLIWYRHSGWEQGTADWAAGSGRVIGTGWHEYKTVMGANDNALYCLSGNGIVVRRQYVLTDAATGAGDWQKPEEVGSGFERFGRVFGFDGNIYGLTNTGMLSAFRFDTARRRLEAIGQLGNFRGLHFGADTDGVIYTYFSNGMSVYHYLNGTLVNGGNHVQVAVGIFETADFGSLIFAGSGRVYLVGPSDPKRPGEGNLLLHRLTNYRAAAEARKAEWATRAPVKVASGWTQGSQANLQGYVLNWSVPHGRAVRAAISSTFAHVAASVIRLAPAGPGPELVRTPEKLAVKLQRLQLGYTHQGCGWEESFNFTVPEDWASGVYAIRLEGPQGLVRRLPFVVRPAKPAQPVAVILPTNTYLAYNPWGGHSQYCGCSYLRGQRRTLSFHRPFPYDITELGGRFDHTLPPDLHLLRWMTTQNIGFDVYCDEDLDRESELLSPYRAVVLPSHPEYYSERQRNSLLSYQQSGGRTLYLGGNGLYERVTFTDDRSALVFRKQNGSRDVYASLSKPASQLLGTNWNSTSFWTFAPYEVVRDHPLLEGTGLRPGATFGAHGINGAASGGEVDGRMGLAHEVDESDIFAIGQNPKGGAEMLFRQSPNGGFVFSASSVCFTGALFSSDALPKILRNVFDRAIA